MDKIRKHNRAEADIQEAIENKLRAMGWFVKSTHGNIYQFGFPDLYLGHASYGTRWLEVKNPAGYSFTKAQLETFPQMAAAGIGIWIATSVHQVPDLLFKADNFWQFFGAFKAGSHRA